MPVYLLHNLVARSTPCPLSPGLPLPWYRLLFLTFLVIVCLGSGIEPSPRPSETTFFVALFNKVPFPVFLKYSDTHNCSLCIVSCSSRSPQPTYILLSRHLKKTNASLLFLFASSMSNLLFLLLRLELPIPLGSYRNRNSLSHSIESFGLWATTADMMKNFWVLLLPLPQFLFPLSSTRFRSFLPSSLREGFYSGIFDLHGDFCSFFVSPLKFSGYSFFLLDFVGFISRAVGADTKFMSTSAGIQIHGIVPVFRFPILWSILILRWVQTPERFSPQHLLLNF